MPPRPTELSASGEAAWQSLHQHAEWAKDPWLAWVFTDHPPTATELRRRLERQSMAPLRLLELRAAEDVERILKALLSGPRPEGHVWVRAAGAEDAARAAWVNLHLRLNERREPLRQRLPGGLVLQAPRSWKAAAREAAPDLWSVRSLVLEPGAPQPTPARLVEGPRSERVPEPVDAELAETGLGKALRAGDRVAEAMARTRLAQARLAEGRPGDAREQAVLAVEAAPQGEVKAQALGALADAERDLEDAAAAETHYAQALEQVGEGGGRDAVWWGIKRAGLLEQAGLLEDALGAARDAVGRARGLGEAAARDLSVALNTAGHVMRLRGRLEEAHAADVESLALCRALRSQLGEQPQVLRDLSVSLDNVGGVSRDLGRLEEAQASYEESLRLRRALRTVLGEQPQVLRDLAVSLGRLSQVSPASEAQVPAHECLATAEALHHLAPTPGSERLLAWARSLLSDSE